MMLDGEKHEPFASDEVQQQIVVHDEFPKFVGFPQPAAQLPNQRLNLGGLDGVSQKGPAGQGKPTQRWNNFIKEPIQEPLKRRCAVRFKKCLDGSEVGREIFGKGRPFSGHAWISIAPGSASSPPPGRQDL